MLHRPTQTEYSDNRYHRHYIELVPGDDLLVALTTQQAQTLSLMNGFTEQQSLLRYAANKWSIKEVWGHLIDTERIMAYRAMSLARGEARPLTGFDENADAAAGRFDQRPPDSLRREYESVRASTLALFASFDDQMLGQSGVANQKTISVRAIAWIVAGHELHHWQVLRERYLPQLIQ